MRTGQHGAGLICIRKGHLWGHELDKWDSGFRQKVRQHGQGAMQIQILVLGASGSKSLLCLNVVFSGQVSVRAKCKTAKKETCLSKNRSG